MKPLRHSSAILNPLPNHNLPKPRSRFLLPFKSPFIPPHTKTHLPLYCGILSVVVLATSRKTGQYHQSEYSDLGTQNNSSFQDLCQCHLLCSYEASSSTPYSRSQRRKGGNIHTVIFSSVRYNAGAISSKGIVREAVNVYRLSKVYS